MSNSTKAAWLGGVVGVGVTTWAVIGFWDIPIGWVPLVTVGIVAISGLLFGNVVESIQTERAFRYDQIHNPSSTSDQRSH